MKTLQTLAVAASIAIHRRHRRASRVDHHAAIRCSRQSGRIGDANRRHDDLLRCAREQDRIIHGRRQPHEFL